jgi:hypothetical protein
MLLSKQREMMLASHLAGIAVPIGWIVDVSRAASPSGHRPAYNRQRDDGDDQFLEPRDEAGSSCHARRCAGANQQAGVLSASRRASSGDGFRSPRTLTPDRESIPAFQWTVAIGDTWHRAPTKKRPLKGPLCIDAGEARESAGRQFVQGMTWRWSATE